MMMRQLGRVVGLGLFVGCLAVGCAPERAVVGYSYVVNASHGLPPGVKTLIIHPAQVGPTTDPKWSDMCVTVMQSLVNESRNEFGTDVTVSDRRDAKVTFDEADLAAAGMSTKKGGAPGQVLAAEAAVLSNINVKVTVDRTSQRTLSGLALWGGGGHGYGHGGADIQTEEVEVVSRNMTVQTDFKLIDTSNSKVWEQKSSTYTSTDRTKASPIFGSSQGEGSLTPQDRIIATLVERGAREFVSRLMPCRIDVEVEVESSGNSNCREGVKLLRAEAFEAALARFESALHDDPNDHRAAFAAGVACEALGRASGALTFYQRACAGQDNAAYRDARDRMKTYGERMRK